MIRRDVSGAMLSRRVTCFHAPRSAEERVSMRGAISLHMLTSADRRKHATQRRAVIGLRREFSECGRGAPAHAGSPGRMEPFRDHAEIRAVPGRASRTLLCPGHPSPGEILHGVACHPQQSMPRYRPTGPTGIVCPICGAAGVLFCCGCGTAEKRFDCAVYGGMETGLGCAV